MSGTLFTVTLCIEIPVLILLWAVVVCGVRWRRGGPQPPRFMMRGLRQQRRLFPQTFAASLVSWNAAIMPGLPWNRDNSFFLHPAWVIFGTMIATVPLPIVVVFYLTRPGGGRSRVTDAAS